MLLSILGWITGLAGPISVITSKIAELGIAKAQASTDKEKASLDAAVEEAHDRRAVLVAEAGNRLAAGLNASMRLLLALGPLAILLKLMFWDKVIGSFYGCSGEAARDIMSCTVFRTDPLDGNQWLVISAVIAFYFSYDIIARFRK